MRLLIPLAFLTLSSLVAQTAFITGSGYTPPTAVTVAPGQVATFYVGGLSQASSALQSTSAVYGVGGVTQPGTLISVKPTDASTLAVTVLIPFSINPYGASPVTIQFSQSGGAQTPPVTLNVISVIPHIIDTCDVFYSTSTTTCQLAVTHQDGSIVTDSSPAKGGEVLTVWALGLGVPASGIPSAGSGPIAMNDIILNTFFAETSPSTAPARVGSTPYLWAGLSSPSTGLYQINFLVPQPPTDLQTCMSQNEWFTVNGNLSISVFRPVTITAQYPVTTGVSWSSAVASPGGVTSICVSQ